MKIKDQDFYHGVVLTQIAEYPIFTSINKTTRKAGLYQINEDKHILIKYSTSGENEWRFTFRKNDLEELYETFSLRDDCHVVLVCSERTICLLTSEDMEEILELDADTDRSQWISVSCTDGRQMKVKGSQGDLSHTVAHNSFPTKLFTEIAEYFAWPPFSRLNFYRNSPIKIKSTKSQQLIFSSEDRMLDLADNLMRNVDSAEIYFGLVTFSHLWEDWTEKNVQRIEELIKYDLEFDGYNVAIQRITNVSRSRGDTPCHSEFVWKLNISGAYDP